MTTFEDRRELLTHWAIRELTRQSYQLMSLADPTAFHITHLRNLMMARITMVPESASPLADDAKWVDIDAEMHRPGTVFFHRIDKQSYSDDILLGMGSGKFYKTADHATLTHLRGGMHWTPVEVSGINMDNTMFERMNELAVIDHLGLIGGQHSRADHPVARVPEAPADVGVTAGGYTQLDIFWTAPDHGTDPIRGYRIEWSDDGTTNWQELVDDTESVLTLHTDTGVATGSTRHYRVYAINRVGISEPSTPASGMSSTIRPSDPPGNLRASLVTSTNITVMWDVPVDNGGTRITAYKLDISLDGGTTWFPISENLDPGTLEYTVSAPPNSTAHFRVFAINSAGTSAQSEELVATTLAR